MHYVYLLQHPRSKKTYIGYTKNLEQREKEHKTEHPGYELVYYEAYRDERDARRRERMLKQRGQTVRRLKERLKHSLE